MNRVLVIDDDKPIAEFLETALKKMGYHVKITLGGREGIYLFNREVFDLVITDVMMPDMDGRAVVQNIRNSERPWTPIIGISGTPWILEDEFDYFLPKPFGLKALAVAVAEVLSMSSVSQRALHG